jgi:large subunit ribosomal protein L10
MKKFGLLVKEISANRIKTNLQKADSFFIVKYSGLSSPDITSLRQSLKASKADIFVVKNSVARLALKDSGMEALVKNIEGPCGLVFSWEEPVIVSKALCDFGKDHEKMQLAGGYLKDRVLEKADIEAMAKLPSREVLLTQAVIAIKSPITGLVMVLNNTLKKLVICLDQVKQKKNS